MKEEVLSEAMEVRLTGIVGLMFDRFVDMSADERPPEEKMYLTDTREVFMPAKNIYAFLFSDKPGGCAKMFEGKGSAKYMKGGDSYVTIMPERVPITRDGQPIIFTKFVNDYDEGARIRVVHDKANVQKAKQIIPSPKHRPVLEPPWEMTFTVSIFKNPLITIDKMKNWFRRGGIEIALGTYRPRFGRFMAEFSV